MNEVKQQLSPKQLAIACLVAEGYSNPEIAKCLGLGRSTIENHLTVIYQLCGVNNRTQLALRMVKENCCNDWEQTVKILAE